MMSRKIDPSVTLKWLFYWQLSTECQTIQYPPSPSPYLRDVIYEWSLTYSDTITNFLESVSSMKWRAASASISFFSTNFLSFFCRNFSSPNNDRHFCQNLKCFSLLVVSIGAVLVFFRTFSYKGVLPPPIIVSCCVEKILTFLCPDSVQLPWPLLVFYFVPYTLLLRL